MYLYILANMEDYTINITDDIDKVINNNPLYRRCFTSSDIPDDVAKDILKTLLASPVITYKRDKLRLAIDTTRELLRQFAVDISIYDIPLPKPKVTYTDPLLAWLDYHIIPWFNPTKRICPYCDAECTARSWRQHLLTHHKKTVEETVLSLCYKGKWPDTTYGNGSRGFMKDIIAQMRRVEEDKLIDLRLRRKNSIVAKMSIDTRSKYKNKMRAKYMGSASNTLSLYLAIYKDHCIIDTTSIPVSDKSANFIYIPDLPKAVALSVEYAIKDKFSTPAGTLNLADKDDIIAQMQDLCDKGHVEEYLQDWMDRKR